MSESRNYTFYAMSGAKPLSEAHPRRSQIRLEHPCDMTADNVTHRTIDNRLQAPLRCPIGRSGAQAVGEGHRTHENFCAIVLEHRRACGHELDVRTGCGSTGWSATLRYLRHRVRARDR